MTSKSEKIDAPAADFPVGYKKPPAETRFKKGQSANPRGRPRKVQRAYTPRQIRRDVLAVTERLVAVRTENGVRKMPFIRALIMKIATRAWEGHAPSQRLLLQFHCDAILEHCEAHNENFQMLEYYEKLSTFDQAKDKLVQEKANAMRKGTRRP